MGKDVVRTGYEVIAADYTAARLQNAAHPAQGSFLEELAARLPRGAAVLDAGCGGGVPVTRWLSERFSVTGIDISEPQVRLARELVPDVQFLCRDMTALDFPDEAFEAICSLYAVIHVPRDEHRPLLRSFNRMLRPGGFLVLCMGAGDSPGHIEGCFGAPMYWSHYDADTNLHLVREAGFQVLRHEIVPDSLDPETASNHLFLLAQKPESATGEIMTSIEGEDHRRQAQSHR